MSIYNKTNWVNGSVPAINATNLNKIEDGVYDGSVLEIKNYINSKNFTPGIDIIAHRGFMTQYPENTINSALRAIKLGCSVECDVQFTSNGGIVLMHDLSVDRTTNGTGLVASLTTAYVTGLDAGNKFNAYFNGVKVPTLQSYLSAIQDAKHLYIELKSYRTTADIGTLINVLIEYGFEEKCTVQSFDYQTVLPFIRNVSKKIRVGALITNQTTFNSNIAVAQSDFNSMMLIPTTIATSANLISCNAAKLPVGVWTINTSQELNDLVAIGYTSLMLNQFLEVPR